MALRKRPPRKQSATAKQKVARKATAKKAAKKEKVPKRAPDDKRTAPQRRRTKKKPARNATTKRKVAKKSAKKATDQKPPTSKIRLDPNFASKQRELAAGASDVLTLAGFYGQINLTPSFLIHSALLLYALVDHSKYTADRAYLIFGKVIDRIAKGSYSTIREDYLGSNLAVPLVVKIKITDKFVLSPGVGKIIDNAVLLASEWLVREQKPDPVHLIAALLRSHGGWYTELSKMGVQVDNLASQYLEQLILELPDRKDEWLALFPPGGVLNLNADDADLPKLTPTNYIPNVSSDKTDRGDQLRIQRYVDAFARVMASRSMVPPLSIGLFGDWGSGKTFFMDCLEKKIHELESEEVEEGEEPLYWSEICHVRFNAWHYAEVNLWASLVSTIFEKLRLFIDNDETDEDKFNRLLQELEVAGALKEEAEQKVKDANEVLLKVTKNLGDASKALLDVQRTGLPDPGNKIYRAAVTKALAETFKAKIPDTESFAAALTQAGDFLNRKELKEAAIRVKAGTETIDQAQKLFEESRVAVSRGGFWWRTLVHTEFHKMPGFWGVIIALITIPVLGYFLIPVTDADLEAGWARFWTAFVELLTLTGAAFTWGRKQLASASQVFDKLDAVQIRIERRVQQARDADRNVYELAVVTARKNEEDAKKVVDDAKLAEREASENLEKAERELIESTSQARLGRFIRERADAADYTKHLGLIAMVHEDFKKLSTLMAAQQEPGQSREDLPTVHRIILYIDDLDRCPPKQVVKVLEAVHLLLFFPLFVVVVGVDNRWVSRALYKHYPDMLSEDTAASISGDTKPKTTANSQDYLEKIFQVPFWLRDMETKAVRRLIYSLIDEKERHPDFDESTIEEREKQATRESMPETLQDVAGNDAMVTFSSADQLIANQKVEQVVFEAENPDDSIEEDIAPATETLRFGLAELEFMYFVAPLMPRTPRSVKRFVNVYRLYKSGLSTSGLSRFMGTDENPGNFRAVQVLLALSIGSPQLGHAVFEEIFENTEANRKLSNIINLLNERNNTRSKTTLLALNKFVAKSEHDLTLSDLRTVAPLVSRYSVHHLANESPGETVLG